MRSGPPLLAALALAAALAIASVAGAEETPSVARFDSGGKMLFPADYREWVYVTSGHGMSYAAVAANRPEPPFDNVFADRAAYRHFLDTGTWPEGTVLVLEIRDGTSHGSILKGGAFQTDNLLGIEVHVKDTARFGGDGWAFFSFDGDKPAGMIGREASCYACHQANTAVDRTFVQFYPTLLPVARAKGTLTPAYLEQEAAAAQ
jgi:hypothetical protein